jgi:hypothetical protein
VRSAGLSGIEDQRSLRQSNVAFTFCPSDGPFLPLLFISSFCGRHFCSFAGQLPSNYALNSAARSVVSSPSEIGPLFPHNPLAELPYGASRPHTNQTLQLIDWLFSPPDDTVPIPPFVGGVDSAGYRSFVIRAKIPVQRHADADWGDLKRHLQPDDLRTEYVYSSASALCFSRQARRPHTPCF